MKYISIGAVMTEGTEHILDVTHGGNKFRLTGEKAALWLNGRCKFAIVAHPSHLVTLEQLFKMGLVFQDRSQILELKVRRFNLRADWLVHSGASLGNIQSLSLFARYLCKMELFYKAE